MDATRPQTETARLCHVCFRVLAESAFRLRSRLTGQRMHQCRDCVAEEQRLRRAHRQAKSRRRAVESFVRRTANTAEPNRIRLLVRLAIDRVGSLEKFASEWVEHWNRVRQRTVASRVCLASYVALANLTAVAAELDPPRSFDDLTDDELDESIDRDLENYIIQHPELARAAAEYHGLIPAAE